MESWRKVWRDGVAPSLSTEALESLRQALATDDQRLIQGSTWEFAAEPPLSAPVGAWPVGGACALGFCGWQAYGLGTADEVSDFFDRLCHEIDQAVGVPAGCRFFLNWFDETPRPEMIDLLLPEVELALAARKEAP